MSPLNQLMFRASPRTIVPQKAPARDRLALYDWYGPVAYGVILQIIPQPELAQTVLVDLFSSDQLPLWSDQPSGQAAAIIRLARQKALAARPTAAGPEPSLVSSRPIRDESRPKLVFDLTFRRGYKPGTVADRLQMTYEDVLQAIRTYVHSFRNR